jgi:anti-sigma B factor antagonist
MQETESTTAVHGALSIQRAGSGARRTIELHGELDMLSVGGFVQELALAERDDAAGVTVDLTGLQFIDSTGVRALLGAKTRSWAARTQLSVVGARGQVARVLRLTGLAAVLESAA